MFPFESIPYFVQVVESGSLSAAASKLDCATSTDSRHIQLLEEYLMSPLFIRNTRKFTLTEEGKLAYQHALKLCGQAEELTSEISQKFETIGGEVTINGPNWSLENYVVPLLPDIHRKWPKLKISLTYQSGYIDPHQGNHDIYFFVIKPEDSSLVMRPIDVPEMWACATPEYLRQQPKINKPEDLANHSLITLSRFSKNTPWRFKHLDNHEAIDVDTSNAWLSFTIYSMGKEACLNHGGVCILPRSMFEKEVLEGKLNRVLFQYECSTYQKDQRIHIVYTKESSKNPRVQAIIKYVMEHIDKK